MLNRLLLILLAANIVGCASYADMKNMEIDRRYEITGISAKALSACMEDILIEDNHGGVIEFRRTFDQRWDRWIVSAEFRTWLGGSTGNYSYSLAFKDISESVIVELRSLKTIWGNLQAPEKDFEQQFRECTKS